MNRKVAVFVAFFFAFAACISCAPAQAQTIAGGTAAPAQAASELLKATMARYHAMASFQANCEWTDTFSGPGGMKIAPDDRSGRKVWYVKPNKFKIVNTTSNGFVLTTVCDGKKLIDYTNNTGARSYPAPASFDSATSMQLIMPEFDGSLLYLFFGGPDYVDRLANSDKEPVSYGPDQTVGSVPCRTVRFYAQKFYGHTAVAIGIHDGLIHEIQYDSAPLIATMNRSYKGKPEDKLTLADTTEVYTDIKADQPISSSIFIPHPPKGAPVAQMPAPPSDKPPVPIGAMAPDFTVKSATTGQAVKLSSLRGKVVLIDFWATWCPPCRKGLPETNSLSRKFGGKGLVVMAISDENAPTVSKFVTANHYSFAPWRDPGDTAEKAYAIQAIPTDVVIDAQGHLVAYMVGLQDFGKIMAALKKAGFDPAS